MFENDKLGIIFVHKRGELIEENYIEPSNLCSSPSIAKVNKEAVMG
jgi:hypothetical protein